MSQSRAVKNTERNEKKEESKSDELLDRNVLE
jgi:hypothetical protein